MLKSMTGFGKASLITDEDAIVIEVSSLNAKLFDLELLLPAPFTEKELDVRSSIADKLQRGRVRVTIFYHNLEDDETTCCYNESAFVVHYTKLKKLADRVMAPYDQLFSLALNAPGVVCANKQAPENKTKWLRLEKCILKAVDRCDQFRITEGRIIHKNLLAYSNTINKQLTKIITLDPERIENTKHRVRTRLETYLTHHTEIDVNRIEQELLLYVERMAIDEELVRLKSHLVFFDNVLENPSSGGKKLTFIVQEIGREINTIGAKANDITVQQCVIAMKEELGKIKEQLHNVL